MFLLRFLLIFVLCLPYFGCADATPPIAGPNLTVDPPTISVPPGHEDQPAGDEPDDPEDATARIPDAIITSGIGDFNPDLPVEIGVEIPEGFAGNSPLVGSAENAAVLNPAITNTIQAQADGSLQFGIYVDAATTPGTYTFFARQENIDVTVTVEITAP